MSMPTSTAPWTHCDQEHDELDNYCRACGVTRPIAAPAIRPLYGHTSPDTAYLVTDYPYGFRLRCQIRYWLESHPTRGFRFVSQTTNPKKPGLVWNKPKCSTYVYLSACMYLDADGHVAWRGLSPFAEPAEVAAFLADFPGADLSKVAGYAGSRGRQLRAFAEGRAFYRMNGVKQEPSADDLARYAREAQEWEAIAQG